MPYTLTRQDLLRDLYVAFFDARKHKASMSYVAQFEKHLHRNMEELCDELMDRTYVAQPSKCFIIDYPKKREVFAAQFRDRIVHHLYYNYTHKLFERTFIADSYSCIPGRGTHYGISRLKKHILQESNNHQNPCYVLKLDIRGYFMHINRHRLLEIATASLLRMASHPACSVPCGFPAGIAPTVPCGFPAGIAPTVPCGFPAGIAAFPAGRHPWRDILDIPFLIWLTREIALLDPKENCERVGPESLWLGLDPAKSLFHTEDGCGLPIGNLTSQLFSNVYLNCFDQYMKRSQKCTHYGRYVDDAYVVSCDKEWLRAIVPEAGSFLKTELGLDLHMGKTHVCNARQGVEFLGAYIKPHRTYIANRSLRRIRQRIDSMDCTDRRRVWRTVNSLLGTLAHYDSWHLRRQLFHRPPFTTYSAFNLAMTKYYEPIHSFTL